MIQTHGDVRILRGSPGEPPPPLIEPLPASSSIVLAVGHLEPVIFPHAP